MMPGWRVSGMSAAWPLCASQRAFSQVTMSSPKAASTIGLPESCTAILHGWAGLTELARGWLDRKRTAQGCWRARIAAVITETDDDSGEEAYLQRTSAWSSMARLNVSMRSFRWAHVDCFHVSCAARARATASPTYSKLCDVLAVVVYMCRSVS